MDQSNEKTIPVVKSAAQSNFPFIVQGKNTENWSSHSASVTLEAAMEDAHALAKKHPGLPVRIEHLEGGPLPTPQLPLFTHRVGIQRPFRGALWAGVGEPPGLGEKVFVRVNDLGYGTVTGYAVQGGYLAVMMQADEATRPAWHRAQNPDNIPALAFGTELRPKLQDLYTQLDNFLNTPVCPNGNLGAPFRGFEKGTARQQVWAWFDRQHPRFNFDDASIGIRVSDE